jgi:hypothetical protein
MTVARVTVILALCVSACGGVRIGVLLWQQTDAGARQDDATSIIGVGSGVDGSQADPLDEQGVEVIDATAAADSADEVTDTEAASAVEFIAPNKGSMQSIRGIKGIDAVRLQNLEAVLRMQAPPAPPTGGGGGGVQAAAALLTTENDQPLEPEQEVDGREELAEFELEGS